MKLYLILLVISGIAYLISSLGAKMVIKKYGYKKFKKSIIEERILAEIKTIILWLMIIPFILIVFGSIIAPEAYEKGICESLEKSGWGLTNC